MHTKGKWEVQPGKMNGDYFVTSELGIVKPEEQEANAKLIAAIPTMYDIVASLAERDCEYTGSAGCDMLPQGVKRRVCLPCKARMIISEINAN